MVSIKCQSRYNARLLAGCSLTRAVLEQGSGGPAPLAPGAWFSAGFPRPELRVSRSARESRGASGPWGRMAEADTRITFRRLPGVGKGKGRGTGNCQGAQIFSFPLSAVKTLQAYMVGEGRGIKKTYKITIEKVILL